MYFRLSAPLFIDCAVFCRAIVGATFPHLYPQVAFLIPHYRALQTYFVLIPSFPAVPQLAKGIWL
jgi:7,8-dihydro-6-hydroxymethylpterin-pyrophosphokinase